jgi:cytidine deaminase
MSKKKLKTVLTIHEYESVDELANPLERSLCQAANESMKIAYAPYSKYKVGAAVLLINDKIIKGSNQENAVFPLGLCAERVAIFASSSIYPEIGIKAIAVKTNKKLKEGQFPGFPCGSCRQTMVEMETRYNQRMKVYVSGHNGKVYMIESAIDLLPYAFNHNAL